MHDDGPGVSSPDSLKIFEEFFRSEEAKRKNSDGLGLGLFIVKKMAREMEVGHQSIPEAEPPFAHDSRGGLFEQSLNC